MRLDIDMIAGSEIRDTQGEVLSIEGADISELEAGRGRFNDNHGAGFFNTIGRITFAKKILKEEDATDERQKYYWNKIKVPFIYVKGYLFDDEDHPNARAAAAILRNIHKTDSPLQLKASVEGSVIARGVSDPKLLARTKIHSVALTFTPANQNTLVEPLSIDKSRHDDKADMAIINSVLHLAMTDVPSFRQITRMASAEKIESNLLKIVNILSKYGVDTSSIKIPSKEELIKKAINKKIKNNLVKIHKEIEQIRDELYSLDNSQYDENLIKNIKAKILGTMVGLAPISANIPNVKQQSQAHVQDTPKITHAHVVESIKDSHPELFAIAQVESSGGKNISHRTIKNPNSVHFGHKAGGAFGLMPHFVALTVSKDDALKQKYPQLAELASDVGKNHHKITELLNSNPELDKDVATTAFKYIKKKTINPDHAFYAWYNGLSGSWKKLKDGGQNSISNHWYVNKVKSKIPSDIKKALYAGYGYAGSPSSLTGGSVLQAESLDGHKGLVEFVCNNCGKNQVYFKHQVKCRHCASPISFDQLKKLTDSYKKNK